MKVWLSSFEQSDDAKPRPPLLDFAAQIRALAGISQCARHELAGSPSEADLVLFPDSMRHNADALLHRHPLWLEFRDKCLLYDPRDRPVLGWPGVYVSAPVHLLDRTYQVLSAT